MRSSGTAVSSSGHSAIAGYRGVSGVVRDRLESSGIVGVAEGFWSRRKSLGIAMGCQVSSGIVGVAGGFRSRRGLSGIVGDRRKLSGSPGVVVMWCRRSSRIAVGCCGSPSVTGGRQGSSGIVLGRRGSLEIVRGRQGTAGGSPGGRQGSFEPEVATGGAGSRDRGSPSWSRPAKDAGGRCPWWPTPVASDQYNSWHGPDIRTGW